MCVLLSNFVSKNTSNFIKIGWVRLAFICCSKSDHSTFLVQWNSTKPIHFCPEYQFCNLLIRRLALQVFITVQDLPLCKQMRILAFIRKEIKSYCDASIDQNYSFLSSLSLCSNIYKNLYFYQYVLTLTHKSFDSLIFLKFVFISIFLCHKNSSSASIWMLLTIGCRISLSHTKIGKYLLYKIIIYYCFVSFVNSQNIKMLRSHETEPPSCSAQVLLIFHSFFQFCFGIEANTFVQFCFIHRAHSIVVSLHSTNWLYAAHTHTHTYRHIHSERNIHVYGDQTLIQLRTFATSCHVDFTSGITGMYELAYSHGVPISVHLFIMQYMLVGCLGCWLPPPSSTNFNTVTTRS